MELDQVYKNILSHEFTWVKIKEQDNSIVGSLGDSKSRKISPKDIKKYINDFINSNPGTYTFEFKKFSNQHNSSAIKYKSVNCNGNRIININPEVSREEIEKEIRIRIEREQREAASKLDYEAKSAELDTVAGKLIGILERVVLNFAAKGNLNGNLNGTNTNIMSYEPIPLKQLTPEQIKKSNEALELLLLKINPDTLHAVATKFHTDPTLIPMLLNFVKP